MLNYKQTKKLLETTSYTGFLVLCKENPELYSNAIFYALFLLEESNYSQENKDYYRKLIVFHIKDIYNIEPKRNG